MNPKIIAWSKPIFDRTVRRNWCITDNNVEEFDNLAFISIQNSRRYKQFDGDDFLSDAPTFKQDHSNVLNIVFDDIDPKSKAGEPTLVLFDEDHARKIINFVHKNKGRNFFVHCTAGVCRSGAVASFINSLFDYDYQTFIEDNPAIQPNQHVLKILANVFGSEYSIGLTEDQT